MQPPLPAPPRVRPYLPTIRVRRTPAPFRIEFYPADRAGKRALRRKTGAVVRRIRDDLNATHAEDGAREWFQTTRAGHAAPTPAEEQRIYDEYTASEEARMDADARHGQELGSPRCLIKGCRGALWTTLTPHVLIVSMNSRTV
jgi:hypothetical protein